MRQLLSGLSIKLQVVVPVFFTLLLLIIGITFSTSRALLLKSMELNQEATI